MAPDIISDFLRLWRVEEPRTSTSDLMRLEAQLRQTFGGQRHYIRRSAVQAAPQQDIAAPVLPHR